MYSQFMMHGQKNIKLYAKKLKDSVLLIARLTAYTMRLVRQQRLHPV